MAKIAGISETKHTSSLIPLCHIFTLTHVRVDLKLNAEDLNVDMEGKLHVRVDVGRDGSYDCCNCC